MIFNNNNGFNDFGGEPKVLDLEKLALLNTNYRTAIWTGKHLQTTLMQINVGDDVGLEIHPDTDQLIIVAEGYGLVKMGSQKDNLDYKCGVKAGCGIFIPQNTWHNVINTCNCPLKLISVYAPPEHPFDTVHATKEDAERAEENYSK